jgi:hypothetical protein
MYSTGVGSRAGGVLATCGGARAYQLNEEGAATATWNLRPIMIGRHEANSSLSLPMRIVATRSASGVRMADRFTQVMVMILSRQEYIASAAIAARHVVSH